MFDPTRIPRVLESVRTLWEGQPDLSFGAVVTILENHGMNWSSTDEEIAQICQELAHNNPAKLPHIGAGESFRVSTTQPERVYVVAQDVVIPDTAVAETIMPWQYEQIVQSAVGGPLKVMDANGTIQRLGIITLISRCQEGFDRQLVMLEDDSRVLIERQALRATIVTRQRRELSSQTLRLAHDPQVEVGRPLVLAVATDRRDERTLAVVRRTHEL